MKRLLAFSVLILVSFGAFAQNDGGMIYGRPQPHDAPLIILWFKVVDAQSHYPIQNAILNFKDSGTGWNSGQWQVNPRGVATYLAYELAGIPGAGDVEIVAPRYRYKTIHVEQWDLRQRENDNRLFLPAFPIQWADLNQIPNFQQLVDLLGAEEFTTGVRSVQGPGGIMYPNEAPPCYKYLLEMDRVN